MKRSEQARFIFNKYANDYQVKHMGVELYSDSLDIFCKYVKPENASILEIGCGPGNLTKYLLSNRPDFKVFGIDIAENMIALARKNNPSADFKRMDCRDLNPINEKFDAILCGFCLPYLQVAETEELIKRFSKMLDSKAVLYVSTMEASSELSGIERSSKNREELYINYYESQFLEKLLKQSSFKMLKTFKIKNPVNRESVNDLVILAEKV